MKPFICNLKRNKGKIRQCFTLLLVSLILLSSFSEVFAGVIISDPSNGAYVDLGNYVYNSAQLTIGGREYAFVAIKTGIKVVDITDPNNPYTVSTTSSPVSFSEVGKENVYKAADVLSLMYRAVCARTESDGESYIYTLFTYDHTTDSSIASGTQQKVKKIKVTNPADPVLIAEYKNTTTSMKNLRDIAVYGNFIYVAGDVVNIFDATCTSGIGTSANLPLKVINTVMYSFVKQGLYLYGVDGASDNFVVVKMNAEPDSPSFGTPTVTKKSLLSYFPTSTTATLRGVAIIGNYAYTCSNSNSKPDTNNQIFVIDLSEQDNPTEFQDGTKGVWLFKPNNSEIKDPAYIASQIPTWFQPYALQNDGSLLYIVDLNKRIWVYDTYGSQTAPIYVTFKGGLAADATNASAYNFSMNDHYIYVSSYKGNRFSIYPQKKTDAAVAIASPADKSTVTSLPVVVTGTSKDCSNILLTLNDNAPVSVTPDAGGAWSYSFTNVPDGRADILAEIRDDTSKVLSSDSRTLTVNAPVNNLYNATIGKGIISDNSSQLLGETQADDTLQLAVKRNLVNITCSSIDAGTVSALTDAKTTTDMLTSINLPASGQSSSNVDITFKPEYTGARNIKDMRIAFNSLSSQSNRTFDIAVYFSKNTSPAQFTKVYEYRDKMQLGNAYSCLKLSNLNQQLSDVNTIRFALNWKGTASCAVGEIDINDETDSADIAAERQSMAADIKMPGLFSDNMMLQRDKQTKVWGTGGLEGENVTVQIAGQNKKTKTSNGKWSLYLDPIPAGGPHQMTVTGAHNTITINNILVGEVWLASGQSNMAMTCSDFINYALDPSENYVAPYGVNTQEQVARLQSDLANSTDSQLRFFKYTAKEIDSAIPSDSIIGSWSQADPTTVGKFSSTAYYFARELRRTLEGNIPVGIVAAPVSGTGIEQWVNRDIIDSDPAYDTFKDGKECQLYNGMIYPLREYGYKGLIWYQGEANVGTSDQYGKLFPALINSWRAKFQQSDMPFLFVSLAPFKTDSSKLREAQLKTLISVPNTALAVITDAGDPARIHPVDKKPVGERLVQAALVKAYGKISEYSGPLFRSMKVNGNKIILSFTHIGTGLVPMTGDTALRGFEISSDGTAFVTADAQIVGDQIEVSASAISSPVAVRYGWNVDNQPFDNPVAANLFNKEGFPAVPFRAWAPVFKINSVKYYDGNNVEITNNTLPSTGNLKVKLNYKNSGAYFSKIIIVKYDNNKNFVSCDFVSPTFDYLYPNTLEQNIDISTIRNGGKVKIMVWDDITGLIPIINATEFPNDKN